MTVGSAWTSGRVLAMAPDPASAKAGQGLASLRKWSNLGRGDNLIWGECQGSGSKPYQTKVAPEDPAFSCSCPSRKFPCKHALGLMLAWVDPGVSIEQGPIPPWVSAWVESRAGRAEAKLRKVDKESEAPVDPVGRGKREAARMGKVAAGLEDLDLWLGDLIRSGFANLGSRPKDLWDEQARRMIDAQCPGVARRLRQIDAMSFAGEGWQAALLDRLAQIHLLIEGFRRLDALPAEVAEDVKAATGFPVDLDAVRAGTSGTHVRDTWQVLGQAYALEDKVTVRRTSLWGRDTHRSALILDFSAAGRPFDVGLEPGTAVDATLGLCPGAAPIRALLLDRHAPPGPFGALEGGMTIDEAQSAFGAALARSPWVELLPVVLAEVSLQAGEAGWSAVDASGRSVPLARGFDRGWHIEALTGGAPLILTGEFDGSTLNPSGAVVDGNFLSLVGPGKKAVADPACGSPGRWLAPDSALMVEATTSALVGVDRKPPPSVPPDHPIGPVAARVEGRPPASRLLAVAAASGLSARAGRKPRVDLSFRPDRAPSTEERPECSPEAARRLREMLAEDRDQSSQPAMNLIFDWLEACRRAGQRLPEGLLVHVLTFGQARPEAVLSAAPILGDRGRWLAGRNPAWGRFAGPRPVEDAASTWETGTESERLATLRALRATDPDRARQLAESTFAAEPAALRAKMIREFGPSPPHLSASDEPFLEAALDDRSQDVRTAAAEQLRGLPDSRLSARMAERARSLLRWDGDRLAVDAPSMADKAMIRDGIAEEPRPYAIPGQQSIGKKAWYLHEVLARTPPASIADLLGRPPDVIIAAARRSDWAEAIGAALENSALRHHDLAWCRALALARIASDDVQNNVAFPKLLATLEPEVRDAQIASKLAVAGTRLKRSDPAVRLIAASEGVFGVELGHSILERIRADLEFERRQASEDTNLYMKSFNFDVRSLIQELDRKLPFALIEEANFVRDRDLPPGFSAQVQFSLNATFDAMLDRWKFRRDMHQEFAPR